jgi:hypothetical protein
MQIIYGDIKETKFHHYKMKGFNVDEKVDMTLGDLLMPKEETEKKVTSPFHCTTSS